MSNTRIIMISRDAKALDRTSAVYERLVEYSKLFDHLDVLVLARKVKTNKDLNTDRLSLYNLTGNIKVWAFMRTLFLGVRIARKSNNGCNLWVTSQDPFESGIVAYIISRVGGIKFQTQFHTDCFNPLYIRMSMSNLFRSFLARFVARHADHIRVVSERIRESIVSLNRGLETRITVLPIWFDVEKMREGIINENHNLKSRFREFNKVVIVVARLEAEKNIDLSLLAFKKVLRFNPDAGLVVVGNGSREKWLKTLTQSLGIESSVRFVGWVSDVVSLFKTADLLLVTSLYEGYGLNMVEAVVCGCPVVATDVGIAKEVGAKIVPYDAGKIALSVVDIFNKCEYQKLNESFSISIDEYLRKFSHQFNN